MHFRIPIPNLHVCCKQKCKIRYSFLKHILKFAEKISVLEKCERFFALLESFKNGPYPLLIAFNFHLLSTKKKQQFF